MSELGCTLGPNEVRLLKIIGQGSFGTVHQAFWRGSLVAVKVIQVTPRDTKSTRVNTEIQILRYAS